MTFWLMASSVCCVMTLVINLLHQLPPPGQKAPVKRMTAPYTLLNVAELLKYLLNILMLKMCI